MLSRALQAIDATPTITTHRDKFRNCFHTAWMVPTTRRALADNIVNKDATSQFGTIPSLAG